MQYERNKISPGSVYPCTIYKENKVSFKQLSQSVENNFRMHKNIYYM